VSRERRFGWLTVLVGLGLAVALQIGSPVSRPLYDGVVVAEPYRYLHPVGDQPGDPTSAIETKAVAGGQSPFFVVATEEQPPQAQLVAQQDAFEVPAGMTELRAAITPVDPASQPTDGSIAGNVYRFTVTDQDGRSLAPKACDGCRTLVMRSPEGVTEGAIARLDGQTWTKLQTFQTAGIAQANVDAIADFAFLTGSSGGLSGDLEPLVFGGVALALFFAIVAGLFWYRRRPAPVPIARLGPGRGRVPSKRKGPRRPPSGRSGS